MWHIDPNGVISNGANVPIGFFDTSGEVYDRHNIERFGRPSGIPKGYVDSNGEAYNSLKRYLGKVDVGGNIYTDKGLILAEVSISGEVVSRFTKYFGSIDPNIHKNISKSSWQSMIFRAAAGAIIILLSR